jgi:hypothetical protein
MSNHVVAGVLETRTRLFVRYFFILAGATFVCCIAFRVIVGGRSSALNEFLSSLGARYDVLEQSSGRRLFDSSEDLWIKLSRPIEPSKLRELGLARSYQADEVDYKVRVERLFSPNIDLTNYSLYRGDYTSADNSCSSGCNVYLLSAPGQLDAFASVWSS